MIILPEPYLTVLRATLLIGGVLTVRYVLKHPNLKPEVTLGWVISVFALFLAWPGFWGILGVRRILRRRLRS